MSSGEPAAYDFSSLLEHPAVRHDDEHAHSDQVLERLAIEDKDPAAGVASSAEEAAATDEELILRRRNEALERRR